jgi:hypothetical protein
VETVHNAAVVKHENQYIMLFHSHLRTGRFNGAHPKRIRWLTTQAIDQRRLQLQRNLQGSTQRCKFGTCKISESDPDNQTSEASRERSREKSDNMKLESEKFQDRLSRSSAIQNAFLVNDVEKAKGLQKIDAAITKSEDKKQTSQDEYPLVSSVVKFGTAYFDQINGR